MAKFQHEDAANFSLIIEVNGQRVRQIDAYHFEPYDEEKVRQEKENKYQGLVFACSH